jgi:hypothetical protein
MRAALEPVVMSGTERIADALVRWWHADGRRAIYLADSERRREAR